MDQQPKAIGIVTKTKYNDLKDILNTNFTEEQVELILGTLKKVVNFDPSVPSYTKEDGKKRIEQRREKSKATGMSQYELYGGRKYYEKKKDKVEI